MNFGRLFLPNYDLLKDLRGQVAYDKLLETLIEVSRWS